MKRLLKLFAVAPVISLLTACASVGGGPGGTVTNGGPSTDQTTGRPAIVWPIKVREHVDLWLHGYAMLQEDTTFVPVVKRGFGTAMTVPEHRATAVPALD